MRIFIIRSTHFVSTPGWIKSVIDQGRLRPKLIDHTFDPQSKMSRMKRITTDIPSTTFLPQFKHLRFLLIASKRT